MVEELLLFLKMKNLRLELIIGRRFRRLDIQMLHIEYYNRIILLAKFALNL